MFRYIFALLSVFLLSGCAIGTTTLQITHEPLERIESKKSGNILVRPFVDKRKENHEHIGNKRNGFGMVLGHVAPQDGMKLDKIITGYVTDALKEAGYTTYVQGTDSSDKQDNFRYDAIVEGEIIEFWLDLYMKVWHNVEIKTRVLSPETQKVLWENSVKADQSNVLWLGISSEFEKVISESMTKALNQAAKDYSSDQFNSAVKGIRQ